MVVQITKVGLDNLKWKFFLSEWHSSIPYTEVTRLSLC